MSASPAVRRHALGQRASVGRLYDARRDGFLGSGILTADKALTTISLAADKTVDCRASDPDTPPSSYASRSRLLRLDASLTASYLCGLAGDPGFMDYLDDDDDDDHDDGLHGLAGSAGRSQPSRVLLCTLFSSRERLDLTNPALRDALDLQALDGSPATHVVTEVWRGTQLAIVASISSDQPRDPTADADLEAYFSEFQTIVQSVPNSPPILVPNSTYGFSIHASDDAVADFQTLDVNAIAQFLSDWTRSHRAGEEKEEQVAQPQHHQEPLEYGLLPLAFFSLLFPVPSLTPLASADPDCLAQLAGVFDELRATRRTLRRYLDLVQGGRRYGVPESHVDAVAIAEAQANQAQQLLRTRLAALLVAVRSGSVESNQQHQQHHKQLWDLLRDFQEGGTLSPRRFAAAAGEFEAKVRFVAMVVARGGRYAAYNRRRPWDFLAPQQQQQQQHDLRSDDSVYVLYYSNEAARRDPAAWQSHQALVVDLLEKNQHRSKRGEGKVAVVVCDCDGADGAQPQHQQQQQRLRIALVRDRKVVVPDVVDEERFAAATSLVACDTRCFFREDRPKPQQRRALRLACPGRRCNRGVLHAWHCGRCRALVECGDADGYLYCDCGYGTADGFAFRCRDATTHGAAYERYRPQELTRLLRTLTPYREMNILILGETGVGKSTFVNAFVNYLTFATLDEAAAHDGGLQWVVPCAFSTQWIDADGQFHQQDVRVGRTTSDDGGEADGSAGQSATQGTTVYRIHMGSDLIVRLIDTPGIGDTRGIEQDRANMAGILATLARFEALHGILLLLRPNSARLTLMFRFCVAELLTHLHRDASRNLVFGFTHTRASNYTPGDAFRPLQALVAKYRDQVRLTLDHRNTYCFDSESFRYLAALQQKGGRAAAVAAAGVGGNGVQEQEDEKDEEDDYRRSWARSEREARRLLEHFASLEPHRVRGTLSLNRARDLITQLTKPMAEIMDVINRTIRINEDHVRELEDERCRGEALRQRVHFQKLDKRTKPLSKPRTVCTENGCVHFVRGIDKVVINYVTHCHKVCYLTEVPKEVKGDSKLSGCAAFAGGNGRCVTASCRHPWQSHMHVWYELEDQLITERDAGVEALLKQHESEIEVRRAAVALHRRRIDEARAELRQLEDAAARFALFLKRNSITPYNDEMLAYLDEQIKEERQIVNSTRASQDRLRGLERTRSEYEQQIRVLEREMQLSADGGGNGGEGGGGGSTEAARRPLDERDVEDLVRGLYGLRGWGQSLRDIKTAAEYYGGAAYRERHFRAHRSWKSSAGWGGRHSSSSGQGHSRVGSHYLPKGGDGDGGDGGNDEETSKSGDMFESLASAAPNFLNDASSYDLSTVSGPLPYRSLLSPVDDDDDPSCQGGSSSAPSRPPPPPYSSSLDAPSPRPCREVEMSISSRFKNGFFGRLRRANKGDTTPSS